MTSTYNLFFTSYGIVFYVGNDHYFSNLVAQMYSSFNWVITKLVFSVSFSYEEIV